jgi:hypothetical protein
MKKDLVSAPKMQGDATEKFFYFFMGLRKGEIRRRVAKLQAEFPDQSPEQLARRLIRAQIPLSALGGSLLHVPMFVPGIGSALKAIGLAGGAAVILRMHLFLVLEIATLFGRDIDERARLREMLAVVAASGLASGSTLTPEAVSLKPYLGLIAGGVGVTLMSQVLGEAAIRYYRDGPVANPTLDITEPAAAG